jgi:hypothetical protein
MHIKKIIICIIFLIFYSNLLLEFAIQGIAEIT